MEISKTLTSYLQHWKDPRVMGTFVLMSPIIGLSAPIGLPLTGTLFSVMVISNYKRAIYVKVQNIWNGFRKKSIETFPPEASSQQPKVCFESLNVPLITLIKPSKTLQEEVDGYMDSNPPSPGKVEKLLDNLADPVKQIDINSLYAKPIASLKELGTVDIATESSVTEERSWFSWNWINSYYQSTSKKIQDVWHYYYPQDDSQKDLSNVSEDGVNAFNLNPSPISPERNDLESSDSDSCVSFDELSYYSDTDEEIPINENTLRLSQEEVLSTLDSSCYVTTEDMDGFVWKKLNFDLIDTHLEQFRILFLQDMIYAENSPIKNLGNLLNNPPELPVIFTKIFSLSVVEYGIKTNIKEDGKIESQEFQFKLHENKPQKGHLNIIFKEEAISSPKNPDAKGLVADIVAYPLKAKIDYTLKTDANGDTFYEMSLSSLSDNPKETLSLNGNKLDLNNKIKGLPFLAAVTAKAFLIQPISFCATANKMCFFVPTEGSNQKQAARMFIDLDLEDVKALGMKISQKLLVCGKQFVASKMIQPLEYILDEVRDNFSWDSSTSNRF